jgi:hypothetical protein
MMTQLSNDANLARIKAERNKRLNRILKETKTRYLSNLPRKVPDGKVLVHNHVQPAERIGLNGFRIWTQIMTDDPKLVACDCGWAPELGIHYRAYLVDNKTN